MKKFLTSFLVALSIVAISAFDTSLSTNTSSLQTKQNTLTIMSKAEAAEISEGVAAPDFTFTDLATGKVMNLSDLRDKPVYLNFWATWCPPCVGELPLIEKKYAEYKDKMHFVILSVDDNEQDPARFIKSKGYSFPAAYGDHQALGRAYGIDAIPASYIISADGHIVARIVGSMNESSLDAFLQKAF